MGRRAGRRKQKAINYPVGASGDDDAAALAPAPRARGEPTERRVRKIRAGGTGGTVTKADSSDEDAPTTPTTSRVPGVAAIAHVAAGQKKKTPGFRRKRQNVKGDEEVEDDAPMGATEEGETAEVPRDMLDDVGGLAPFDSVPLDAPESEVPAGQLEKRLSISKDAGASDADMSDDEEEESEEEAPIMCPNLGCGKGPFKNAAGLTSHARTCRFPAPALEPVDKDAAAELADFDARYAAAPHKVKLVDRELGLYMDVKKRPANQWASQRKLDELRKRIAAGAPRRERKDPVKPVKDPVKLVVARCADEGDSEDASAEEGEDESEEEAPIMCPNLGCDKGPFVSEQVLSAHKAQCMRPAPRPVPVDEAAAAKLTDFETRYAETPHKSNFLKVERRLYAAPKKPKKWNSKLVFEELCELIASGAEELEKKDPVKPVVAWCADEGAGAQKYLCLGGRKQASKAAELEFARKTGLAPGGEWLCQLIRDVADGKVKHDIVGARWPTDEDLNDATIIKIARDIGGGRGGEWSVSLTTIAREHADDRATREKDLEARAAADAKQHQDWCRVANAMPNVVWTRHVSRTKNKPYWHNAATGQSTWHDPSAFVKTPRVALPVDPEAQKRAIAGAYASRPRGRGLGDLISPDPEVRARAIAATTGDTTYGASRAPAWEG